MTILSRLEKAKEFWFLLAASFLFFLLRLPSLFEPDWYGDEGIYQVIGIAIRNGRLLYRDIWDNKPPLLYLTYAAVSSDQFLVRLLSLIFGLGSIIAFFFLLKKLFPHLSQKVLFISTSLFAFLLAIPLLEGNIANSENFMMPLILLAALLIFNNPLSSSSFKFPASSFQLIVAGFLLSLAFLFKIVAIFDFAAFFLFLFIATYKKAQLIINQLKYLLVFTASFLFPIIGITLFFTINGAFSDFFQASFMQNVGYVSYGNKLLIPQGFLFIKLIILASITFFLFLKRSKISHSTLFIILWLSFSVFNAFFSQRPYTHYVLVVFPSLMLFLTFSVSKAFSKTILIAFAAIILVFIISANFNFYKKTSGYYQNFLSFLSGNKDINSYRAFFDRNTPKDYMIAQFIKAHSNPNDGLFIWGDNAQLYVLSSQLPPGRFTVAYHIRARKEYLSETYNAILKEKPKFIVVISPNNPIPYSLYSYKYKLTISNSLIYERTF